MHSRALILASGSRYRRELLGRLGLAFACVSPDVDETAHDGEAPHALAERLAAAKAAAVEADGAIVIGSDQAPSLAGSLLRKPGGRAAAIAQLLACQGQTVTFHTAVCVLDTKTSSRQRHVDTTTVRFSALPAAAVERYVDLEQPFDCAGGFRAEGLGISLFEAIDSCDPTGLIGLPLIAVSRMLRTAGLDPLAPAD